MIDIRTTTRSKAAQTASSGGGTTARQILVERAEEAEHATRADEAKYAAKADTADRSAYADNAGTAQRSLYSDEASSLSADSEAWEKFLRKDKDDTAHGTLTMDKAPILKDGAQLGEAYEPGLAGSGGRLYGDGGAELRSLRLWEWLEVPELRYNRVSVNVGMQWLTSCAGIIESVTPDGDGVQTGVCTLKLEDGEIGAVAVGDLCMGIWHDDSGNADANSDDCIGNFTFAGFKTVYFQITGFSGAHNENFTYMLRGQAEGGNGFHPFVGMHFAGRGNISDTERQAFTYTTTEYSVSLTGVNTWEFQPANYYEIHGHLEGFSMPAIDIQGNPYTKVFHGYGQVFGNAYMFGQIDQFERIAYRMEIEQELAGTLAPGETEGVACTILDGYGKDVTAMFTRWKLTRNTGDAASDGVWNAVHTDVGNPFQIGFDDLGIDGIDRHVAVFTVTATDEEEESVVAQMTFNS